MTSDWPFYARGGTVLLWIEDFDDCDAVQEAFRLRGWKVVIERELGSALDLIVNQTVTLVITDDEEFAQFVKRSCREDTIDGAVEGGPPLMYLCGPGEEAKDAYEHGADLAVKYPLEVDEIFTMPRD